MKNYLEIVFILFSCAVLYAQTPEQFEHNVSTSMAFYYPDFVTINGVSIDSDDWVGAFYGDICIGAKEWDTSQCGGGICGLVSYGDDTNDYADGYILPGETPTFKIYDTSADKYYDADIITSDINDLIWENMSFYTDLSLNASTGCTDVTACNYDDTINTNNDDGTCLFPCSKDNGCLTSDSEYESDLTLYNCDGAFLSNENLLMPKYYNISNIYPNPFNPITSINYELPENSYISIMVYNIAGEYITSLINKYQIAGFKTIKWNASNFPSGLYLVRMEGNNFTQTQKVVLAK